MRPALSALALSLTLAPAGADPVACPVADVRVSGAAPELAARICDTAARAGEMLAACGLAPGEPLDIRVVDEMEADCAGVYHCGERRIDVLSPEAMARTDARGTAFAAVSPDAFFDSVIVHEMTHAALDAMPCPFPNCMVAQEYLAYGMQVMSLPPEARAGFETTAGLDRAVSRDELNVPILGMAPHLFAQKAWTHLTQRDDPCSFAAGVAEGAILLDREHF